MSMTPEQGFFQQEETQDAGEERCKQGMLVGMAFECLGQQVKQGGTKQRTRLDKYYEIEGLEAPPEEREMDLLIPPPPDLGNIVVELEGAGVNVGSEKSPRWLFRNLTLSLRPGQCTGIVGKNGVGKTTLLKLCLGQLDPTEGTAVTGKRVKVNYIDQTRMVLDGTGSLLDEISDGNEKLMFGNQPLGARNYLRRFLFDDKRINERVDLLSGGERARLMLAKVLKNGGNVIDLPSLRMLEEALAVFDGSVIVVSHDRYFLDRICDQIIAFEDDGIAVQTGNYSYYLEKRQAREAAQRIQAQAAAREAAARYKASTAAPAAVKKGRKLTFNEKNELEGMETAILAIEQETEALEAMLHDPDFQVKRFAVIPELVARLDADKAKVAKLYTRWEELEAIREAAGA